MSSYIRQDRSKNEIIREKVKVAPIDEKMTKYWWLVMCRDKRTPIEAPTGREKHMKNSPIVGGRGRQKTYRPNH